MQGDEKQPCKKGVAACTCFFQDFVGKEHKQAGVEKRQGLQIFKSQIFGHAKGSKENQPDAGEGIMERRVVIGKKLVRIHIRQLAELINIFDITDMSGVYLAGGDAGINPFVMLPVVQAR